MSEPAGEPKVSIGYCSETGARKRNEDFVGAVVGGSGLDERRDVAAAIAPARTSPSRGPPATTAMKTPCIRPRISSGA